MKYRKIEGKISIRCSSPWKGIFARFYLEWTIHVNGDALEKSILENEEVAW